MIFFSIRKLAGVSKARKSVHWSPLPCKMFKFNVDGATKVKLGLVGIGGVLCIRRRDVMLMFSRDVGIRDSNEVESLKFLEALWLFSTCFHGMLVMESDSYNAID